MQSKLTIFVSRKRKRASGLLAALMAVFAVLFLILGILFTRGFFLPCFLMTGLYFLFDVLSKRDYEYIYEDNFLQIDLIRGKRFRTTEHRIDLAGLVVAAPHDHEAVAAYRRGGRMGSIARYDYTSYDDSVPYYTLIAYEEKKPVKLLLDLDDAFLLRLRTNYPDRVFRE